MIIISVKSRSTRQKEIIEEEVEKFTKFFSAEDLLDKVKTRDNKLGIATIYRNLKKMKEDKNIYSYSCCGKCIYSNSKKSHCHFTDERTGEVVHFEIDNIDFIRKKLNCDISSFSLEVRGELKK